MRAGWHPLLYVGLGLQWTQVRDLVHQEEVRPPLHQQSGVLLWRLRLQRVQDGDIRKWNISDDKVEVEPELLYKGSASLIKGTPTRQSLPLPPLLPARADGRRQLHLLLQRHGLRDDLEPSGTNIRRAGGAGGCGCGGVERVGCALQEARMEVEFRAAILPCTRLALSLDTVCVT